MKESSAAVERVDSDLWAARIRAERNPEAAALFYLGLGPAPEAPKGPSAQELAEAKKGLEARHERAKALEAEASGAVHAKMLELLRRCAERAAPAYRDASRTVAALHAQIGTAQAVIDRVAPGAASIVDPNVWAVLNIPGSQAIAALRDEGNLVDPAFGTHALAGGDVAFTHRALVRARDALEASIQALCGGASPFAVRLCAITRNVRDRPVSAGRNETGGRGAREHRAALTTTWCGVPIAATSDDMRGIPKAPAPIPATTFLGKGLHIWSGHVQACEPCPGTS